MRWAGIDLGSKCGWAYGQPGRIDVGTWRLKRTGENVGAMTLRLRNHLVELAPDVIGYELITFRSTAYASQVYGALKSALEEYADGRGVPLIAYTPAQIKKRATGKGNARKPAVKAMAERAMGRKLPDDNAADAYWAMVLLIEGHAR